jgi:hypothetical protein
MYSMRRKNGKKFQDENLQVKSDQLVDQLGSKS